MTALLDVWQPRNVPSWLRALGCFDIGRRAIRFRWGELSFSCGLALEFMHFEDHASLCFQPGFGRWFVRLPHRWHREPRDMLDSWGFSWDWANRGTAIHLHWGPGRVHIVHMPWAWEQVRHEVMQPDGTMVPFEAPWNGDDDGRAVMTVPYRYVCNDGEVQDVQATFHVEEREHRWMALQWLPWPRLISRCIEIEFDAEVGEGRGSWKGGCLGTGYRMRHNETPLECLRRMQSERRFSR